VLAIDRPPNNSHIPVLRQFGYSRSLAPLLGNLLGAPKAARIVRARSNGKSRATARAEQRQERSDGKS